MDYLTLNTSTTTSIIIIISWSGRPFPQSVTHSHTHVSIPFNCPALVPRVATAAGQSLKSTSHHIHLT